jgi:hypothetical protein
VVLDAAAAHTAEDPQHHHQQQLLVRRSRQIPIAVQCCNDDVDADGLMRRFLRARDMARDHPDTREPVPLARECPWCSPLLLQPVPPCLLAVAPPHVVWAAAAVVAATLAARTKPFADVDNTGTCVRYVALPPSI